MASTIHTSRIRLSLDMRNCILRRSEFDAMNDGLDLLEKSLSRYTFPNVSPVAALDVVVDYRPRSDEFHVRTRLVVQRRTFLTGEHDAVALPAYERCIRKLTHKLEWRRRETDQLRCGIPAAGTGRDGATDTAEPAAAMESPTRREKLRLAALSGDSLAFREELAAYHELIRHRVGNWVRRYSEAGAMRHGPQAIGDVPLPLEDLVEDVALTAFERYPGKPPAMRTDDWLISLIDPAMRSLLTHPDEELDAIGFARTLRDMEDEQGGSHDCDGEFDDGGELADRDEFDGESERPSRRELFRRRG